MKRTLSQIRTKIYEVASELRENAAYSGERGDNGASRLEGELTMFITGFQSCLDVFEDYNEILNTDTVIEVPYVWRKYFIEEDKDYKEYLRLKEKFENGK